MRNFDYSELAKSLWNSEIIGLVVRCLRRSTVLYDKVGR
jgi:hypothetical protein